MSGVIVSKLLAVAFLLLWLGSAVFIFRDTRGFHMRLPIVMEALYAAISGLLIAIGFSLCFGILFLVLTALVLPVKA